LLPDELDMPTSISLERAGHVLTLRLSLDGGVTTLSRGLATELRSALGDLVDDKETRCLVISGSGSTFAVGADLNEIKALSVKENLAYNEMLIEVNEAVAAMPFPVVACINGHAFGGGLELALACSIRVASKRALFGLPEVRVGILPGSGATVRLPRIVPRGAAMRLMLSGETIDATEAYRIGLVDILAAPEDVVEAAGTIAGKIAGNAPLAVQAVTAAVREVEGMDIPTATRQVHAALEPLVASEDLREGIAAFLEKRPAVFNGS
jgi:enoyl-CoA hydratase